MHKQSNVIFLLLTALLFGASTLMAQTAAVSPATEPWPFELSNLEPDPAVTWGQFENGVRYAIMPNQEPRERVSLRLLVRAGSLHEEETERGLAHFLEHMAFNGTENFGPGTLVQYFQRLGMAFGADTNAYTGFDRTVYMIELPDTEAGSIDEGLLVLRDYAGRMLLETQEIDSERGVVLSEMRSRDSVGYRTALAEYKFLLPEARLPERFPIGTAEVLRGATREDFVDFFDAWYRPERTVIVIVGDVDPGATVELIEKNFSDFEARAPARDEPAMGQVVSDGIQAMLHAEGEASSTRVAIQTVMPYEAQPDTLELRTARLHRTAATQMLSRRLESLARQEDAPFSQGTVSASEVFDFATNASIDLTCEPDEWEKALAMGEQELRRALQHGFQDVELREVKAELLNRLEESARRAPTRQSPGLAEGIIRSLSAGTVFTSPEAELELMEPILATMTVEQAHAALLETWSSDDRFLFVTGNLVVPNAERRILEVFEASQTQEVEPLPEMADLDFAYTDFGLAGETVEMVHVEDLDLHQVTFANGVRLNVKRTDFQANTIQMLVRFGGGLLTEPVEADGVGLLASTVFTAGGLGEHSADELRRILAGRNVGTQFSIGNDAFQFSGSTTPGDLLLQLQLTTAYLADLGYRPESLRRAQTQLREMYRTNRHTARGVLQAEVARFLAGGDHRFGLGEEQALLALGLNDVRAWLSEPLANGYLEVSLVGDLSVDEAVAAVAETLGALPDRERQKPDMRDLRQVSFPSGVAEKSYTFTSEIPSGYAAVYWPTTDIWDIGETRRLQVLAQVFSDRMRIRIREEMGEAYSPNAASQASDTYEGYGLFFGLVGVEPGRAEAVTDVMMEIAADLVENGINEDEMERVLRPLMNSLRTTVRNNSYWLNSVLGSSQEYPQRLDWAREMVADIQSIEPAELSELAVRYLGPDRALRVGVTPVAEPAN